MSKKIVLLIFAVFILSSCQNKDKDLSITSETPVASPSETASEEPTPSSIDSPTIDLTGKALNPLTGLYISEEAATRRPFAIVINNLHKALPQSGIAQADIIYEVLAEGDITRFVAIFSDFNSQKIGPVRSARDYFLLFAADYNAIFVHHGGSPKAYSDIKKLKVNDIDGMSDAKTFWRDKDRVKIPSMYEHSSYTNAQKIFENLPEKNYETKRDEALESQFLFYDEPTSPQNGIKVVSFEVPYSTSYNRIFEYDEANKTYKVSQGKKAHIDEETGEQLTISNVLVQFTKVNSISSDTAGRRSVLLTGKGQGFLFTNGVSVPILWEKEAYNKPTKWFFADGTKLSLNKGKTWINVFDGELTNIKDTLE